MAPIAMPATLSPFIAAMTTIRRMVPIARPPRTGPPDVEHPVEVIRDAGLGQHIPHVNEHRQGHERVPVEQDEAGVERHLEAALTPERQGEGGGDEADGAEHPLTGRQQKQHRGEHQERDELVAHASGSPLAFATFLKNTATTCSSISAMPMHMMILIGASGGAHEE